MSTPTTPVLAAPSIDTGLRHRRVAARRRLRRILQDLVTTSKRRSRPAEESDLRTPITTRVRQGYVDGRAVDRFVIFLKGSGCAWMAKTGGCTFCGFWAAHNLGSRVSHEDHEAQLDWTLTHHEEAFLKSEVVCLYNGGSMIDDREVELHATEALFRRLATFPNVRNIVIEAKVGDINGPKLERLVAAAAPANVSIAIGFESANEVVRDLCVNKNFDRGFFERQVALCRQMDVGLIPLVMIKPPFLTDREAFSDAMATLVYLDKFGLERIDLELPVVKPNTLMRELWDRELYAPPPIALTIQLLRAAAARGLKTPIFWSPPNIPGDGPDFMSTCDTCAPHVEMAVHRYNGTFDPAAFDILPCHCLCAFGELCELDEVALVTRIERAMDLLSHPPGSQPGSV